MIHHGDLFDVLPTLPEASIDACVTDPPYGIGFMGKQWDTFKPGVAETRIVPNRAAESDNPNLKGRKRGPASSPSAVEYDRSLLGQREFQAWTEAWARYVWRVLKPGAHLLVCGAPRSYHRMASGLEDAGFEVRDCLAWLFGQGFPKSLNFEDGWGTALKPAYEPIVLARKPIKGSVKANRDRFGTGAINVDACRLDSVPPSVPQPQFNSPTGLVYGMKTGVGRSGEMSESSGRWPANVLLDEEAAAMLDEQSGDVRSSGTYAARDNGRPHGGVVTSFGGVGTPSSQYADNGGASRFFYVAKPSRDERDMGCYSLPERSGGEATGRQDGSAGTQSPRAGAGRTGGARNHHPTVKPIELMRWLVRLVTPVGGTVLDPFTGSGTTGCACAFELRPFIGIEREAEYVEIAKRRIAACAPLFTETA